MTPPIFLKEKKNIEYLIYFEKLQFYIYHPIYFFPPAGPPIFNVISIVVFLLVHHSFLLFFFKKIKNYTFLVFGKEKTASKQPPLPNFISGYETPSLNGHRLVAMSSKFIEKASHSMFAFLFFLSLFLLLIDFSFSTHLFSFLGRQIISIDPPVASI